MIVTKTGWLLHGGCRHPSELLLPAFARDARKEIEERVQKQPDSSVAHDITASAFPGLGLAIIGEVEGSRPATARAAEDLQSLILLLKEIITGSIADQKIPVMSRKSTACVDTTLELQVCVDRQLPQREHRQQSCPTCREGLLVKERGQLQCRDCGQSVETCPECDGWLQTRMGRYGRFWGCTGYPICTYTRKIRPGDSKNRRVARRYRA